MVICIVCTKHSSNFVSTVCVQPFLVSVCRILTPTPSSLFEMNWIIQHPSPISLMLLWLKGSKGSKTLVDQRRVEAVVAADLWFQNDCSAVVTTYTVLLAKYCCPRNEPLVVCGHGDISGFLLLTQYNEGK